jgi:hypothetical protein
MSCSMRGKMATARTTKINRAVTVPHHGLEHYCRDLKGWPRWWMGLEKDLPPDEQVVTLLRLFLDTWQRRPIPRRRKSAKIL